MATQHYRHLLFAFLTLLNATIRTLNAEDIAKNEAPVVTAMANLKPEHDGREVTIVLTVTKTQLIGGEHEGQYPHVILHYQGMREPPFLSVKVKGDLADALHRFACIGPHERLIGRSIEATGKLNVHTNFPKGEDQPPIYELELREWNKFQIIAAPRGK